MTRAVFFSGGCVVIERNAPLIERFKDLNERAMVLQWLDVLCGRWLLRCVVLLPGVRGLTELTSGGNGDALIS